MTLPMGPSALALTTEKSNFIQSRLIGPWSLIRWAILSFIVLIIPSIVFVSIESAVTLTLLGILGGFMLRNLDPLFGRIFGISGHNNRISVSVDVSTAVPFIFPFVFMVFLGWIFDFYVLILGIVQMFMYGYFIFSIPFVIQIMVFISRTIVLVRLVPVARMIIDPDYVPNTISSSQAMTSGPSSELLSRNPAPTQPGVFTPFQGSGNTLQSNPSE
jgi:hypothetical protein